MRKTLGRIAALTLTTVLVVSGAGPALAEVAVPTATVTPSAPATATPPTPKPVPKSATTTAPVAIPVPGPPVTVTPTVPVSAPGSLTAAPGLAAATVSDAYLAQVLVLANKVRVANGVGSLLWNTKIASGSQQWAATIYARINNDTVDMNRLHRSDADDLRIHVCARGQDGEPGIASMEPVHVNSVVVIRALMVAATSRTSTGLG